MCFWSSTLFLEVAKMQIGTSALLKDAELGMADFQPFQEGRVEVAEGRGLIRGRLTSVSVENSTVTLGILDEKTGETVTRELLGSSRMVKWGVEGVLLITETFGGEIIALFPRVTTASHGEPQAEPASAPPPSGLF